ncbi:cyclic-di-AMP receptor [Clostridium cellulovorans]|uniref:Nitrogen regulatory protein P-II n=1 Tax=Clostridium cellulovorans (strain ATCC 35296 / DSM 3052 / OCM 3 / 743B) TaxID=573061 RepID=D9SNL8_CLOC7|nr:cyclic-di-AMP receptor [Clostridium cellulovorans]ADL49889.1 protein of unknown function DUF970 [Clostridium cellulovorans 743B]
MKLVLAIVQDEDVTDVVEELTDANYRVTKLATTGGFLRSGNTTLLIGVEEEMVDEVISIIKEECQQRNAVVSAPSSSGGTSSPFLAIPVEIEVGGANIFVVDVDKFVRV